MTVEPLAMELAKERRRVVLPLMRLAEPIAKTRTPLTRTSKRLMLGRMALSASLKRKAIALP